MDDTVPTKIRWGRGFTFDVVKSPLWFVLFALLVVGVSFQWWSAVNPLYASQAGLPLVRSEGISEMQSVSPGVGWVFAGGRLLWTNDNGTFWNDITPQGLSAQSIHSIFSLDAEHSWIITVGDPGSETSDPVVRLLRTEDGGRTWQSLSFDLLSHSDLKKAMSRPKSLFFVDSRRGWFLWRNPTSSAFSSGKLLRTDDGGISWTELPDPPAASAFRFHTPLDGWMAGGAGGDDLWVTQDGGGTWQARSVSPPSICSHCRPLYEVPGFQSPNSAVLAVTFVEERVLESRFVHCTYVTQNGGSSWQLTEAYEQTRPYPKTALISSRNMQAIRVFSGPQHGIQIRTSGNIRNSSYPKGLPAQGFITNSQFADDSNGWLIYQAYVCNKFRDPGMGTGAPALPCVDGVRRSQLLSTNDGGQTFRVITPPETVRLIK
jgi:photosystem II stability/assembly factor-like uncharacterized protein